MPTECNATLFEFEAVERRAVVAGFDGGDITSNAGALLLGQVDRGLGLMRVNTVPVVNAIQALKADPDVRVRGAVDEALANLGVRMAR